MVRTPGLLLWGAAAVVGDRWLLLLRHNLHSSDLRDAFTSPLLLIFPRIAFTDPCAAFTDPLHSACSSFAALKHLAGSVELFEAFISFFPRSQLGSPGAEPGVNQELTRS